MIWLCVFVAGGTLSVAYLFAIKRGLTALAAHQKINSEASEVEHQPKSTGFVAPEKRQLLSHDVPAKTSPLKSHIPLSPSKPVAPVALFVSCETVNFPLKIPRDTVIHVLRLHPQILEKNPGLYDIRSPVTTDREWPEDREAEPLKATYGDWLVRNFFGMKCTVKKYGDPIVDNVIIDFFFRGGKIQSNYKLVIDPLESGGAFSEFTFYMINCCYEKLVNDTYGAVLIPVIAEIPNTATVHVLGESGRRNVDVTVPYRGNEPFRVIFLLPSFRRWLDLPPCL
ncbi:MAG TPA: hypothetical protein VGI16_03880 [Candidatus Acidoferrum sp.]|jgi:hypothetical protein